jgi:oligoendopeptidase F
MTYSLGKWDLSDLYPAHDSAEMKKAFEELEAQITAFEAYRDKLDPQMDVEEFMSAVEEQEKSTRLAYRIGQFAGLQFAADTQDQEALAFNAKVEQFMAGLQNKSLFFSLWWKSLEDEETERFKKVSLEYEYWLKQIRNFKPYTLTEPEEKIINIKDVTGVNAICNLYSTMTDRYVFKVEVDGEVKELTRGELMALVYGPDPDVRAACYQELYRVFGEDGLILGQMYQAIVRDYRNEKIDMRGFARPISVRNLSNDIPDEVIDVLLDVAEKNAMVFQRYFKLKAKWLKVDKLRRYDIYAPVAKSDKKYDYNDAVEMVLESFNDFDPKTAELAKRIFDEDHIDSEVRKGKRTGAFCSYGDPALTPYVMVNYNGKANDVGTLAHELGHAIHGMLAEHHNVFAYSSTLPLAETASTFAEMLLNDLLLEEEDDEAVRRDILFSQIDDAYATIMRQIYFALFEREAHEMVAKDASVDELCAAYQKNLERQFGDSLEVGEEFKWEWVSIPHIYYTPFYVYAYAFGQLLVFALYQQYKNEGKKFIPRYLEILSAGGSMPPIEVLDRAGVDVRTAEFWQGGFDVIAKLIDDLEAIPVE